jgi:hypothetical protein
MTGLSRKFSMAGLTIKKHSPEILLGVGLVGVVTSAVMACKATTKMSEILAESQEDIEKIHTLAADESIPDDVYSAEDEKKDLTIVYAKTGLKIAKNYAPAVAIGVASITSILVSYGIMHKRNAALAAAYTIVDTGFKEYRGRVVDRFGEALDRELKYNIKSQEVTETVVDENGEVHEVKKTVDVVEKKAGYSEFARFYDDGCKGWSKSSERNLKFLLDQQRWLNDKCRARGHLTVNELYEALGIPIIEAGCMVGWVFDEDNGNYDPIDFGIFDITRQENRDFVNGYERVILLDIKPQGNIFELMKRR